MKIYDISQELLHAAVFDGDTKPLATRVQRLENGDTCNLTDVTLCTHNGTHIDAPFHMLPDGGTIDQLPLSAVVGTCVVLPKAGQLTAQAARAAATLGTRLLWRGETLLSPEAAAALAAANVQLVGVERQNPCADADTTAVHRILLQAGIVLLEGIRLGAVPDGRFLLCAQPLCIAGSDGAPCRAILLSDE